MAITTFRSWKPGMELPYVLPLGQNRMLAISLPASWLKADKSGEPALLPPAVRALDRLRALFTTQQEITPGFIVSLREAIGLTQEEFARKLGVSKMTVSRWECGRMRPAAQKSSLIRKLQAQARREGRAISGEKRVAKQPITLR